MARVARCSGSHRVRQSGITLLKLPPEIRLIIYEFLFTNLPHSLVYEGLDIDHDRYPPLSSSRLAVLLTCRTIYHECHDIAFRNTPFYTRWGPYPGAYGRDNGPGDVLELSYRLSRKLAYLQATGSSTLLTHISISHWAFSAFFDKGASARPFGNSQLPNVTHVVLNYAMFKYAEAILEIGRNLPRLRVIGLVLNVSSGSNYTPSFLQAEVRTTLTWLMRQRGFENWKGAHLKTPDKSSDVYMGDVTCFGMPINGPVTRDDVWTKGALTAEFGEVRHTHIYCAKPWSLRKRLRIPWKNDCPPGCVKSWIAGS